MLVNVGETNWLEWAFKNSSVDTTYVRWMVCTTCGGMKPVPGGQSTCRWHWLRTGVWCEGRLVVIANPSEDACWAAMRMGGRAAVEALVNGLELQL
jgi:hypothetical protein